MSLRNQFSEYTSRMLSSGWCVSIVDCLERMIYNNEYPLPVYREVGPVLSVRLAWQDSKFTPFRSKLPAQSS